ncbi:hypothetical protein MZH27_28515 [Escherichia coli]|nr:hypothetical protein [Escherichia coli]
MPSNTEDPTMTGKLRSGAIKRFKACLKKVADPYIAILDRIQYTMAVNKKYTFQIYIDELHDLLEDASDMIDEIFELTDPENFWFWQEYVKVAYQRGTSQEYANLANQSVTYSRAYPEVSAVLTSQTYRTRLALVRTRVFEEMRGLTAQIKKDMARRLTEGMARGLNPLEIARTLQQETQLPLYRCKRIARTEICTALRTARMDEAEAASDELNLRTMQMHISALSPTTRLSHAQRHGKTYTIEEQREWWSRSPNSINCYLPGTVVHGRFLAGSKAHYSGKVIKIVTRSGRNLTVTPNHPVMTNRGLIPAAEINKGDYAVAYGGKVKNTMWVTNLDRQLINPAIEDVFSSLSDVGKSITARVSAVDFHGDGRGMNEYIDVVTANGELVFTPDPLCNEALDNLALKHANPVKASMFCSSGYNSGAITTSSSCGEGGFSDSPSFVRREFFVPFKRSFLPSSVVEAVLIKQAANGNPTKADAFTYGLDTFPGDVSGIEFVNAKIFFNSFICVRDGLESGAFHRSDNVYRGCVKHQGDIIDTRAGQVFFDEVIDIVVSDYSGHVYDLQELSGLMIANGLIASNCKCSTITVLVDEYGNILNKRILDRAQENYKVAHAKYGEDWE